MPYRTVKKGKRVCNILVALSPFWSQPYSPTPSPSTRTTPSLAFPTNSVQVTLPTLEPRTCPSNSTSHWGDYHPNRFATRSPPPIWIHLHSAPLSMPLSKLRTAVISNISTRSRPRTKNTRLQSTSLKKTSSSPSPISLITRRPLSKLQMGMSLTIDSPHSPSPSEKGPMSPPNGSNNSMMDILWGIVSTMAQGTSPMSKRSMLPPWTALSTRQRFFPTGFGKPFKGHPSSIKNSARLYGTLTTGGFMPKSSTTASSMRTSSLLRPSLTSTTPCLPWPKMPDFSPLLGWKWRNFPNGFHIWQPQFRPRPISPFKEPGRKDVGVLTKGGCDVIDLTNEDSSSDDEEL